MRKLVPIFVLLLVAAIIGCGGSGGGGGGTTGTTSTTSGQFLQYAAPGEYSGSIDDFPQDRSCTLTIEADPNDPAKPKPLSGEDDFNCSIQINGGSGALPGRINGHLLSCWNPDILVFIEKMPSGRLRIWAEKPGTNGETWINVATPGVVVNPPPPVP